MKLVIKKSDYSGKLQDLMDRRGDKPDDKLERFRKLILDHLSKQEDENEGGEVSKIMQKALNFVDKLAKGGKGLPVGTVREWGGEEYVKVSMGSGKIPGKWKRKYDGESRDAKMAVSDIKKKVSEAKDVQTMLQIVLENRDRFADQHGQPLPFVMELSEYVAERGNAFDKEEAEKKAARAAERKAKEPEHKAKKENMAQETEAYNEIRGKVGVLVDASDKQMKEIVRIAIDNAQKGGDNKKLANRVSRSGKAHAVITPGEARSVMSVVRKLTKKQGIALEPEKKLERETAKTGNAEKPAIEAKTEPEPDEQNDAETRADNAAAFKAIQEKYQNAKSIDGDEDDVQVGKELIHGKWRLVEADTPAASHDETNFHKTPGFPADENGSTINDRDYEHDKDAQNIVFEIAGDFDGRAVSVDNPVIVTKDGIVISGNNRTMSSKIAARKGTDTGYIEALKRKAKKFGLTAEQIGEFQHPRVIFETAENDGYNTEQFAKFNKSSKKAMSPIEAAVKVSKTIKSETVEHIAEKISDFDTLGELYSNTNAINEIFNTLQKDGVIASVDRPQYIVEGGGVTGAGKEFLETVLIGSVVTEKNIRGLNRDGCKSIRQKLVRAITPLIENKGMSGYSITKELNEAVDLSMQVAIHKNFNSVDELVSQGKLFGKDEDPVSVEIARKLEGTQKSFAEFMQTMNGGLKYAAQGEADIFLGGVESREDILGRMLNLKKAMGNVIDFFKGLDFFKGDFVKKAVPVFTDSGAVEYADRWMPESNELSLKKAAAKPVFL